MSNRTNRTAWNIPALIARQRASLAAGREVQVTEAQTNPELARALSQAVDLPQLYGDATILPITFAAAGDLLVLPRPRGTRTLLLITNILPGNPVNYSWDRAADAVTGIPLGAAGGFRLFDNSVPQNDLHIFSPVAGLAVLVEYMNVATGAS